MPIKVLDGTLVIMEPGIDPQHVAFTINTSLTTHTTIASGANSVPFNTWSHIAAISDGTTMQLYVNGIQVGSAVSPPVLPSTFTTLFALTREVGQKSSSLKA